MASKMDQILWLEWFNSIGISTLYKTPGEPNINHHQNAHQITLDSVDKFEKQTIVDLKNNHGATINFDKVQSMPKRIKKDQAPQSDLSDCKTLAQLREKLENFDGCDLKKTATNTVFSDGNELADIMLVGEAPGAEEDIEGRPFCGLSGQLLDKILASIGLDRTKVYITNVCPWRPPGNRLPTPLEIRTCLPFLRRHIELVNPKILLCVGGTATKALLDSKEGIVKLRGQWTTYTSSGLSTPIDCMPVFHPAFLMRSPGQKAFMWRDMLNLQNKLETIKSESNLPAGSESQKLMVL